MGKTFRFLWQYTWVNLAALIGFALVVILGVFLPVLPSGVRTLMVTYYNSFPVVIATMLMMYAMAVCTSNLNMAVSFGARRRDFFLGMHLNMAVYTLVSLAVQLCMDSLPSTALGRGLRDVWLFRLTEMDAGPWMSLVIFLGIQLMGAACGILLVRSRVWGSIVMVCVMLFAIGSTIFLLLFGGREDAWGDLPAILTAFFLVGGVVCEVVLWRCAKGYCVR